MPAIKHQAITLRRLDYSESSQVLVFLTHEHGPQRLIAKGIKRGTRQRFATGIDLLERGRLAFIPRSGAQGLGTLTEWRQDDAHLGLRRELRAWYAAQYAAEVTAAMTEEGDPHPELFAALAELLGSLSAGAPPAPLVLLVGYQCTLLQVVGLAPDLSGCVMCGKPAPPGRAAWYSAQQGGLVCRECEPTIPEKRYVPTAVLTALRQARFEAAAGECFELLDYTLTQHMGRPPATGRALRGAQ